MLAALAMQRVVRPESMYRFYRKEIPLAAGLSNVNLNGCWSGKSHLAPVSGYVRISPTGPMAPVVLSVTTLGTKFHLALTYRAQLLSEPQAQQMLASIVERLMML